MIRFPLTPNESAVAAYVVSLVEALTTADGNIRAAAEALDMSEHTLRHRMKDLGLVAWNRKAHPLSERQPRKGETDRLLECPRCGSDETRRTRNYGRPIGDEQWCTTCGHRWEPAAKKS